VGQALLISEAARALVLEPHVGGRFYEDWGGGESGLWATGREGWLECSHGTTFVLPALAAGEG
jgi:hypothetical protein